MLLHVYYFISFNGAAICIILFFNGSDFILLYVCVFILVMYLE